MISARAHKAELDLVAHRGLSTVKARSLVNELESTESWFARFGLIVRRVRKLDVRDVRRWMLDHGYMTERQMGAGRSDGSARC